MRAVTLGFLALTGCVAAPAARLEASARPVFVEQCVALRHEQVGELPLELQLAGGKVRITEWILADEEATSAIGFRASVPAGVSFHVRAGADLFSGTGGQWLHPRGFGGPRVAGIDDITFCRAAPAATPSTVLALAP